MKSFFDRFKEPSSWAGIAVAINVIGGLCGVAPGVGDVVTNAAAGICALAAFVIQEKA